MVQADHARRHPRDGPAHVRIHRAALAEIVERHGLPAATDKTIHTPQALRLNLEVVRQQGFAVDDEEASLGIRCVAAPVFDNGGEVIAALSISGPASRICDGRIPALGERVRAAAALLTRAMGGVP